MDKFNDFATKTPTRLFIYALLTLIVSPIVVPAVILYQNWDEVQDAYSDIWDAVKSPKVTWKEHCQ